jgi:tyrosyl-tRNA synthetase
MSIPDELMIKYYRLASTVEVAQIDEIEAGLANDKLHPNKVKRALARNIVEAYYDEAAAQAAESDFDLKFKEHGFPEDAPVVEADLTPGEDGTVYFAKIIVEAKAAQSVSEARRLIDGGGVKVNGTALPAKSYYVTPETVAHAQVQVGKKKFFKLA